jgi:hypothetical protein
MKRTDRTLIACEILLCAVFLAVGLLAIRLIHPFESPLRYSLGLALGCASSVVKIILLRRSLEKTLDMDGAEARTRGRLHAAGRYLVTMAAVVLAILFRDLFGVIGLIVGILSMQLTAFIVGRFPMRGDA